MTVCTEEFPNPKAAIHQIVEMKTNFHQDGFRSFIRHFFCCPFCDLKVINDVEVK